MSIEEHEAADALNKMGFKSAWGCSDGVFIESTDVFRIVKKLEGLSNIGNLVDEWDKARKEKMSDVGQD